MRARSWEIGTRSSAAASLRASQKGASSEMDVRCPAIVKERLTGRIVAAPQDLAAPTGRRAPAGAPGRARGAASVFAFGPAFLAPHAIEALRFQFALGGILGAL